jgi:H+/gluconate symporter-like permease
VGIVGLLFALAVLIFLALRGVNIIIAALTSSIIVLVTNDLNIAEGLTQSFAFGKLGAFSFFGRFFLLFLAGAIFGKLMTTSGAAGSIAHALAEKLGAQRSLWIIVLATALLTYGGVLVFVVIFSIYSFGVQLIQRAHIPKRLMVGAVALGAGTFTLTAMPGTPSLNNVIAASALGTDLYAAPLLGIVGSALMFGFGMWYLERERIRVVDSSLADKVVEHDDTLPNWALSLVPMATVLLTIAFPKVVGLSTDEETGSFLQTAAEFAFSQPIFWPSFALFLGSLSLFLLFKRARQQFVADLGMAADSAIMPLLNTSMVIGFAAVVTQTASFKWFVETMTTIDLPPVLSMLASVSVISAITGSSSGGLQIFMQTMAQTYVDIGIPPEIVHRLSAMASGGFDSLPHCGAVIAILIIMESNHRESYKEMAIVTVAIPVVATLATAILAWMFFI